jgi:beta-lactamase class A
VLTRRRMVHRTVLSIPALLSSRAWMRVPEPNSLLQELESRYGGRLGVAALDTGSGARIERRARERFLMCSTFKAMAAALVLTRVDKGIERLDRRVEFTARDIVTYSPVTEKRAGPSGMTIDELCEAAITMSDNTAGNLLLATFGGPAALTAYFRTLGDSVTRLDRIEPDLNETLPGDPRDTTTPAAMLADLQRVALGNRLSPESQRRLVSWLVANRTGDARLRAGVPKHWQVGDKTGSGSQATANDIAIVWPPGRKPLVLSVYYTESSASPDERNAVLADVARLAVQEFTPVPREEQARSAWQVKG